MLITPIIGDNEYKERRNQTPQSLLINTTPTTERGERGSTAATSMSRISGNPAVRQIPITTESKATINIVITSPPNNITGREGTGNTYTGNADFCPEKDNPPISYRTHHQRPLIPMTSTEKSNFKKCASERTVQIRFTSETRRRTSGAEGEASHKR
jgi:hypothetical protein